MTWSQLRCNVIVCSADIGGIDDHHCLNFLFIIMYRMFIWERYINIEK